MNKFQTEKILPRYVSKKQAREYLNLSENSVVKIAKKVGAFKKIGKLVRIDLTAIDFALEDGVISLED